MPISETDVRRECICGRVLQALPTQGTLLGNVTYFLGRIALLCWPAASYRPAPFAFNGLSEIAAFPFRGLRRQTAHCGNVRLSQHSRNRVQIQIVTDLVEFPVCGAAPSSSLLVYSVIDSRSPLAQLITAFPITKTYAAEVGDVNAWAEGLPYAPVSTRLFTVCRQEGTQFFMKVWPDTTTF